MNSQIINNNILLITINRPDRRNAIDRDTADKLYDCFKEFEKEKKLNVAILYGGENYFCSGADLKELSNSNNINNNNNVNRLEHNGDRGPMGPTRLQLTKPVIGCINGYCVAGGLELALWCDLRVCSTDAVFGVYCRRWGVPLIDGGTIRLPRLIGQSRALDLILTGRSIYSKEALEFGLVNRVVEKEQVLNTAIEMATLISSFPQECMRSDRLSCYQQFNFNNIQDALENEFKLGYNSLIKEGVNGSKIFSKSGQGRHGNLVNLQSKL